MRARNIQVILAATASLIVFFNFGLDVSAQNLDGILACRSLDNDAERLRCFDESTRSKLSANQSPAVNDDRGNQISSQAAQRAQSSSKSDDLFGTEDLINKSPEVEKRPRSIRAKMVGLRFTNTGKYVMTLDNGQVWRQIPGDSRNLVLPSVTGDGIPIIIKKGVLGSHSLRTQSSKRTIKVERLK
ncbi:MAG: hypothetical protein AAGD92_10055 [Pseudomonadota bacterium]